MCIAQTAIFASGSCSWGSLLENPDYRFIVALFPYPSFHARWKRARDYNKALYLCHGATWNITEITRIYLESLQYSIYRNLANYTTYLKANRCRLAHFRLLDRAYFNKSLILCTVLGQGAINFALVGNVSIAATAWSLFSKRPYTKTCHSLPLFDAVKEIIL